MMILYRIITLFVLLIMVYSSFGFGPYGMVMSPVSLQANSTAGGNYSYQATINSVSHTTTDEGTYLNYLSMNTAKPYTICSHPLIAGDYNSSGNVDIDDFALFGNHWLVGGCTPWNAWCGGTDMNNDARVDINDFAEFASLWLQN